MNNFLSLLQKKKKWVIIALVILLTPFLLEVTGIYASGTWRYKMTVILETPEGIKKGSAVRQVSDRAMIKLIDFPSMGGRPAEFKGEGVVVDLGERGLLFTTLGLSPHQEFYSAFGRGKRGGSSTIQGIRYYNWQFGKKKKILKHQDYPQMVMFTDMDNPKSLMLVKGWRFNKEAKERQLEDNIEEQFGQGIQIKEVSIERTRMPVTWKVNQYLPKTYQAVIVKGWRDLPVEDRKRMGQLTKFKHGE